MTEPNATPSVRKVAAENGVDLSKVTATGAGGRITVGDVRAAAGLPRTPAPPPRRPVAHIAARADQRRNPLLAAVMQRDLARAQAAAAKAPAPTLFHGGDLPPFTASGIDPTVLLGVPWEARHAMAQAPTTAAAYAIAGQFEGLDTEAASAVAGIYHSHQANADYQQRMDDWLVGAMTDEQIMASLGLGPTAP